MKNFHLFLISIFFLLACGNGEVSHVNGIHSIGSNHQISLHLNKEDSKRFCEQPAFSNDGEFISSDRIVQIRCRRVDNGTNFSMVTTFNTKAAPTPGNSLKELSNKKIQVELTHQEDVVSLSIV